MSAHNWRVGSKVPINVYEGDRPVCQCHTPEDAFRIVRAMNMSESLERIAKTVIKQCGVLVDGDYCPLPAGHSGPHKWGTGD